MCDSNSLTPSATATVDGATAGATTGTVVTGRTNAKVKTYPINYWKYTGLKLYYGSKLDCSLDEKAAKNYKKKANVPLDYVTQLQTDLIALGYLPKEEHDGYFGGKTKRALTRFERHAKRVYRMKAGEPADVKVTDVFSGSVDGVCDHATATEIRKWVDQGWVIPVGRFPLVALSTGGKLRADAAKEWEAIVKLVAGKGGILAGPYGDTTRPMKTTSKVGASRYSFHYCGRAVDINQGFASGKNKRYYIAKRSVGNRMYWRIFCSTDKQDGTQGTHIKSKAFRCFRFYDEKEYDIKDGYYLDLTALIESRKTFESIPAQKGWDDKANYTKGERYNKSEWWHFQYKLDKQETFQDEAELIGFTEETLRSKGWKTDTALDHKPG